MSRFIGSCPYCSDGEIKYHIANINGRKTKLYSCTNRKIERSPDEEGFELDQNSLCTYRLFGNALQKWGKKFIGPKEAAKLIKGEEIICHLYSFQKKTEYKKYAIIDHDYGISVLWDQEVEE
jgi:hypothetical protein